MISRRLKETLKSKIDYKKAIVLLGPRQVGKTTLITQLAKEETDRYLYINGDDPAVRLAWSNPSAAYIRQYIGQHKVVIVDEAQRLENIGLSAKMIVDGQSGVQVFISGSSALEIANRINEPLTGRKWEYRLYPLSWAEIAGHYGFPDATSRLNEFLIYGGYPEVVTNSAGKREILANLAGSYLYKDILESGGIRKPELLLKLLQALAWQVGSEVSYNELAQLIGIDKNTVSAYIDLLEKAFVIFRLGPFARNLRNEISTSRKIYFYDNGVRNTLINNFAPIDERNDVGALWENFLVSERKKKLAYDGQYSNSFFWRTTSQAEVDYLEEMDGKLHAWEFKWNPKAKVKFPSAFIGNYQPETTAVIHRDNFWEWLA